MAAPRVALEIPHLLVVVVVDPAQVVELQMAELNGRLADQGLTVELTTAARDRMVEKAYDPAYGARPLRRYIQHQLETRVGRAILSGEASPGTVVRIGLVEEELDVSLVHG